MLNKKGMLMVEAAIIYPIVIGAMIALIYIVISIYTAGTLKTNMNCQLRKDVMELGKTGMTYEYVGKFFQDRYASKGFREKIFTYEGRKGAHKVLYGNAHKRYAMRGIFRKDFQREHQSRAYVIDEAEYIRRIDMLKTKSNKTE